MTTPTIESWEQIQERNRLNQAEAFLAIADLNERLTNLVRLFRLGHHREATHGREQYRYTVTLRPPYGYLFSEGKKHSIEWAGVWCFEGIAEKLKTIQALPIEPCPNGNDCLVRRCSRKLRTHFVKEKRDAAINRLLLTCLICDGPITGAKSTRVKVCSAECRRQLRNAAARLLTRGSGEAHATRRAHRQKNAEDIRAKARAYREANRERILANKRAYYQKNAEDIRAKRRNRWAKRKKGSLTQTGGTT